jgi:isoleucyl-tRNA synthetase
MEQIIADEVNVKSVVFGSKEGDIELNTNITPELKIEGNAREMIRNIQSLRKKSNFNVDDRIEVYYQTTSLELEKMMNEMGEMIGKEVLAKNLENTKTDAEGEEEFDIDGEKISIGLSRLKN